MGYVADSLLKKEAAAHNFVTKADIAVEDHLRQVRITDDHRPVEKTALTGGGAPTSNGSASSGGGSNWSIDEQRQLEIALKSIPAGDPARWDKISEFVSSRTKRECMLRFKECAEKMKAKKAAQ